MVGRQPGQVAGPLADHHQVLGGDADVLGGDVAAAERLDQVAEVQQQRTAVLAGGRRSLRGADHSLAPAELQPGRRGLVGHAPRQPEGIAGAVDGRLVVPQTDAAQGRPERGRVDGDDHVPAAAPSLAHDEVLVVEGTGGTAVVRASAAWASGSVAAGAAATCPLAPRLLATALASLVSISCPPFARAGQWDLHRPGQLSPLRDLRSRRLRTGEARVPPLLPYLLRLPDSTGHQGGFQGIHRSARVLTVWSSRLVASTWARVPITSAL